MPQTHALHTIADLRPGDHACCLYSTDEEHRAVLAPFLREGLERRERVAYSLDAYSPETVYDYLRGDGVDPEPYLASGQLVMLAREDTYAQGGASTLPG